MDRVIPEGCRCRWVPQRQETGGDVAVRWVLWEIDPGCWVHTPDRGGEEVR